MREMVIGRSDSEYMAPDPADAGLVEFDEFPGLTIGKTDVGLCTLKGLHMTVPCKLP
jgi:hypothetical protein